MRTFKPKVTLQIALSTLLTISSLSANCSLEHLFLKSFFSIHQLTEQSNAIYELRIEITDFANKTAVAK